LNPCSVNDYRATTNYLDESKIDYHTFQLSENKQLSIVIRNLPVNITEQCIFNELTEQKFEVTSVTRLQNKFKNPLPIVAVLLSNPSTGKGARKEGQGDNSPLAFLLVKIITSKLNISKI